MHHRKRGTDMSFREASFRVALRRRWRVLVAAIGFLSFLLITVFLDSSLVGWTLLRAITFALLLTIWIGIIAWLISPVRNWRMFPMVLMAIACLLLGSLAFSSDPPLAAVLGFGSAGVLLFVAALRIKAPTEEERRLAAADRERGYVSWWIQLLVIAVLAIPALAFLVYLFK